MKTFLLSAILAAGLTTAYAEERGQYTSLGRYYAATGGVSSQLIRLPGSDGVYREWLSWGYPIWGDPTEAAPEPGWVTSESLFEAPYNVPRDATAVRLHIKTKVAGVAWAENAIAGVIQVSLRPAGERGARNEIVHSATQKPAGQPGVTPYDLNHVETDLLLGSDGRIDVYRDVSVIGSYAQVDLIVYLAGYWR